MKIAQVVLNLKYGGLEKLVIQLSDKLNQTGIETVIVCLEQTGQLASEANRKGIKVICVNKKPGIDFKVIINLIRVLKQEKINVVHTHNYAPLIYATLAAKWLRLPLINTRHSRTTEKVSRIFWNLNRFVVCVSEDTKEEIIKHNAIDTNKLKVIYNGISLDGIKDFIDQDVIEKKKELNLPLDSFVIGNVGRLVKDKDQETLIKAFALLIGQKIKANLVIVGDGLLKLELMDVAKRFAVMEQVKFLGFRDDIAGLLNLFDVYALSSVREGISLTLLEAMAVGKPIVATSVGGNPEVVVDCHTGFLVSPKSPEALCDVWIRLYNDKNLRKDMGILGQRRFRQYFSLDQMANEYKSLYESCLNK